MKQSTTAATSAKTLDISKKIILITGATSGIGKETARELALDGARIILLGRNKAKTLATKKELFAESGNKKIDILIADISSLADVRRAAAEFNKNKRYPRLDILINNAGLVMGPKREVSKDGFEMTFASNHLGHFLLTALLFNKLKKSDAARIINVSSKAHTTGKFDVANTQLSTGYSSLKAYGNSKLDNILFTQELARRLANRKDKSAMNNNITTNCLHPGVISTAFGQNAGFLIKSVVSLLRPFMITPADGAKTTLHLARSDEGAQVSGLYFEEEKQKATKHGDLTVENGKALWILSEKLAGVKFL